MHILQFKLQKSNLNYTVTKVVLCYYTFITYLLHIYFACMVIKLTAPDKGSQG